MAYAFEFYGMICKQRLTNEKRGVLLSGEATGHTAVGTGTKRYSGTIVL